MPSDRNHRAKSRAVAAAGSQMGDQHGSAIEASMRNVRRLRLRATPQGRQSLRGFSRNAAPDLLNLHWSVGAKAAQVSSWNRIRRWVFPLQHGAKAAARSARVRDSPVLNRPVGGNASSLPRADRVPSQGRSKGVISARECLSEPRCAPGMSGCEAGRAQCEANRYSCDFHGFVHDAFSCRGDHRYGTKMI
jgi:hypothetical protein